MLPNAGPEAASKFLNFVNASPTAFHAVHNAALRLEKAGFRKIRESEEWDLKAGGKYYLTRNQCAWLAFTLPSGWKQGSGLSAVATHVDSPNFRIRPVSKREESGYLQVAVETYGGGLWHTWFDRDLGVAGRVVVADKSGGFKSTLIKVDRPIMRIPNLAIHLNRSVSEGFKFDKEKETTPILGLIADNLNKGSQSKVETEASESDASSIQDKHHPQLLSLLAEELSVQPEQIHDLELALYDTQPACFGGINNEFVFSARLDNLFSSFCAVEALAGTASSSAFPSLSGNVNCIALFNHEEIGSQSTSGAMSDLIPSLLERLSPTPATLTQSKAKSFVLSSDVAHAVHPNYLDRYEKKHKPQMNRGVTIKMNASQKYSTDAVSSFVVKKLVEDLGGQVQDFEVPNNMACGSTVGPMLSKHGVRTVDIGMPILSMHSIRETAGSHDFQTLIDLFSQFFTKFASLDKQLSVD